MQVADSAYARADGLVGEIDNILRRASGTATVGGVEIAAKPVHWPVAYEAFAVGVVQAL